MNSFILDNTINSRANLGLRITQPPVIPMSKRLVDSIAVDGREGSLTILRGWEDVRFNLFGSIPRRSAANLESRYAFQTF